MRKIYVNPITFECHATKPDDTFLEIETKYFDDKCDAFIEGYRFIPHGESWTRSDGIVFKGKSIAPFKPYNELDDAQREYEMQLLLEYEANLAELDALILNYQYNDLIEGL